MRVAGRDIKLDAVRQGCSTPEMRQWLDNGVTWRYAYHYADRTDSRRFEITLADCQQTETWGRVVSDKVCVLQIRIHETARKRVVSVIRAGVPTGQTNPHDHNPQRGAKHLKSLAAEPISPSHPPTRFAEGPPKPASLSRDART